MKHSLIPYSQPDGCSNLAHDPRFMMGHCLPRGVQLALAICVLFFVDKNTELNSKRPFEVKAIGDIARCEFDFILIALKSHGNSWL